MAIFLQRAQQSYAARQNPYVISGTIPQGAVVRKIVVTLTRVNWSAGPIGLVQLVLPNGSRCDFGVEGGNQVKPNGEPLSASKMEFESFIGDAFPPGAYSLEFTVLQTVATSLLVERF